MELSHRTKSTGARHWRAARAPWLLLSRLLRSLRRGRFRGTQIRYRCIVFRRDWTARLGWARTAVLVQRLDWSSPD